MAAEIRPTELVRLAAAWPVDKYGPAGLVVELVRDGPEHEPLEPCGHRFRYQPEWTTDGGRRRLPLGPTFDTPREAEDFLVAVEAARPNLNGGAATAPNVSPLEPPSATPRDAAAEPDVGQIEGAESGARTVGQLCLFVLETDAAPVVGDAGSRRSQSAPAAGA